MCPPCEYSLKRTSTNLIQSRGGQCCSKRPAHNGHCFILSLHCQKESTSLNAARHEIYRNRRNLPPLKSLPQPTRTWHCTCRESRVFDFGSWFHIFSKCTSKIIQTAKPLQSSHHNVYAVFLNRLSAIVYNNSRHGHYII